MELEVTGADRLRALAARLREAADTGLEQELYRGLDAATVPARAAVMDGLPSYLPNAYAAVLSGSLKLKAQRRTVGAGAGVRITGQAQGKGDLRHVGAVDKGVLKHPLWGNRRRWYAQVVRSGFFSQTLTDQRDAVREQLVAAMDRVAAKIAD